MEVKWYSNAISKNNFKFAVRLICLFILTGTIILCQEGINVYAEKATAGQDKNGNTWLYDTITNTLTFSGNNDIGDNASMDGHSPEPSWYQWEEETEHLIINEGITGIGEGAFDDFTFIKTVEMGDSVNYIETMAFDSCWRMKTIKLSANILKIHSAAFRGCRNLENFELPNGITYIGNSTFGGCQKIVSITIPDNVKFMGDYAFVGCSSLSQVKLPKNLLQIKNGLFLNCKNLKHIIIPTSVTSVTMTAFTGTGLRKITLPKNVEIIKKGRPAGGKVFNINKKLQQIVIQSKKIQSISKGAFSGLKETCTIKIPKNKCEKYKKFFMKSGLSKKIKVKAIVS